MTCVHNHWIISADHNGVEQYDIVSRNAFRARWLAFCSDTSCTVQQVLTVGPRLRLSWDPASRATTYSSLTSDQAGRMIWAGSVRQDWAVTALAFSWFCEHSTDRGFHRQEGSIGTNLAILAKFVLDQIAKISHHSRNSRSCSWGPSLRGPYLFQLTAVHAYVQDTPFPTTRAFPGSRDLQQVLISAGYCQLGVRAA